jgi:hypothetical protein
VVPVTPDKAPAEVIVHVGVDVNKLVGVVLTVHVSGVVPPAKPTPKIVTVALPVLDPEFGVSWIVGRTVKVTE